MKLVSFLVNKKRGLFIGGILTGLVLPPLLKSKTARKAAVNLTAKGMELRDNARATYESIKEDAQDIYAEAKQKAENGDAPTQAAEE